MAQDAVNAQAEIAKLKFQLARYRRAEFGRSSEKLAREAEQLELTIETLETDQAERLATVSPEAAAVVASAGRCAKAGPSAVARPSAARGGGTSGRPRLPKLRPRAAADRRRRDRDARLRAGPLQEPAPAQAGVIRHIREKRSCRACDTVVAGRGTRPRHRPRPCRCGAVGAHRRIEVRRPSAALPPGRDLCARRCQLGNLDLVGLGRGDGGGPGAAGRRARG